MLDVSISLAFHSQSSAGACYGLVGRSWPFRAVLLGEIGNPRVLDTELQHETACTPSRLERSPVTPHTVPSQVYRRVQSIES